MAKRSKKAPVGPNWLSDSRLFLLEAILLVGLAKEVVEGLVLTHPEIPPIARVLLGMMVVISAFGGLLVVFRNQVVDALASTHATVRQLPVPMPRLAVHALALVAITLLYAWFWNDQTHALAELQRWVMGLVARED